MNIIDKLLTAVGQLLVREGGISVLANTLLNQFMSKNTALAGDCWTETQCGQCHGLTKSCRDRECCVGTGCGPWGGWYQVGCTP